MTLGWDISAWEDSIYLIFKLQQQIVLCFIHSLDKTSKYTLNGNLKEDINHFFIPEAM